MMLGTGLLETASGDLITLRGTGAVTYINHTNQPAYAGGAIGMPSYQAGDLLLVCSCGSIVTSDINGHFLTAVSGGPEAKLYYRIATDDANDTFTPITGYNVISSYQMASFKLPAGTTVNAPINAGGTTGNAVNIPYASNTSILVPDTLSVLCGTKISISNQVGLSIPNNTLYDTIGQYTLSQTNFNRTHWGFYGYKYLSVPATIAGGTLLPVPAPSSDYKSFNNTFTFNIP
jgi:hypothetical protein